MPRKGCPKVRTGCLTCKKRRVKCDEARPACRRCATTGRKCDGYAQPAPFAYSWDELLAPRLLLAAGASTTSADRRALACFHEVVTNAISDALGGSGWIQRLTRMAQTEPAVTHAALAISALHEQLSEDQTGTQQNLHENALAIQHYNAAIRCMVTASTSGSADVILLVCALFVCIEFLRSNAEAAISHYRHGVNLLNSQQERSGVAPMFYHWSVLPFFYSFQAPSFPRLKDPGFLINKSFKNHTQAQETIDWLAAHALQLGRAGDNYRLALGSSLRLSVDLVREQRQLNEALRAWSLAFSSLRQATKLSAEISARMLLLEMRWLVWKVYVNTCLEQNEMVFDAYLDHFQRILEISAHLQATNRLCRRAGFNFSLEMGYYTSLYFIVVNCRHLCMRLTALRMLNIPSRPREMLWNVATFYAIGKHLIEIEHGVELTTKVIEKRSNNPGHLNFPPDRQRIRGTLLASEAAPHLNGQGMEIPRQSIHFVMPGQDGDSTYTITRDIPFDKAWLT